MRAGDAGQGAAASDIAAQHATAPLDIGSRSQAPDKKSLGQPMNHKTSRSVSEKAVAATPTRLVRRDEWCVMSALSVTR